MNNIRCPPGHTHDCISTNKKAKSYFFIVWFKRHGTATLFDISEYFPFDGDRFKFSKKALHTQTLN